MNEAELIAGTIDVIEKGGWTQGRLIDPDTQKHCILGAVGKARWGPDWDLECLARNEGNEVYNRLRADELTNSLVSKLAVHLYGQYPQEKIYAAFGYDDLPDVEEDPTDFIIGWNDDLLTELHGQGELLAALRSFAADLEGKK